MNTDWRTYPFQLVPGDSQLDFPAAEGEHPDQESDTWFIAGQLDAAGTGRSFAFLTIFNKNQPGRNGSRRLLHDGAIRPRHRRLRHLHRLRHAAGEHETRSATQDDAWPQATSTSATRAAPARHRGPPAATATGNCCPTPTASAWSARIRPAGPMGLDLAVTPTRAPAPVGRIEIQREDRLLRPKRHLLLLPDRNGDDRNLAVGRIGRAGQRQRRTR